MASESNATKVKKGRLIRWLPYPLGADRQGTGCAGGRTAAHGALGFGFHYATKRQVGAIGTSNYSEKPGAPRNALILPDELSI